MNVYKFTWRKNVLWNGYGCRKLNFITRLRFRMHTLYDFFSHLVQSSSKLDSLLPTISYEFQGTGTEVYSVKPSMSF